MKLYNSYSLDGYFRPYWAEWDARAVKNLDPLSDLAGCLEPRFYRAPNRGNDQIPPFGYLSYALTLLPGSYILGFMHAPQLYGGFAALELLSSTGDGLLFTAVASGSGGDAITIDIPPPAGPLQSLSVGVVGSAITITPASDANSMVTSTNAQVQAAVAASGAAAALVGVIVIGDPSALVPTTPNGAINLTGGGLNQSQVNYMVQVSDRTLDHRFFSSPIRDDYLGGQPSLLEVPYPVVSPGNFLVEFWNTSQALTVTGQLIFIVNEPVPHDLLTKAPR
jgi:hypothetical protein